MTPETKTKILKYILTPLSWIYGSVTAVRNWMFDNRILPQEEFGVPIVSVGNLTVGGTGKMCIRDRGQEVEGNWRLYENSQKIKRNFNYYLNIYNPKSKTNGKIVFGENKRNS